MSRLFRLSVLFIALVTAAVSSLAAAPLQFGSSTRLSQFRTGAPGDDLAIRVEAANAGFVAYWGHHQDETRSVAVTGNPPKPDLPTARSVAGTPPAGLQACNETH